LSDSAAAMASIGSEGDVVTMSWSTIPTKMRMWLPSHGFRAQAHRRFAFGNLKPNANGESRKDTIYILGVEFLIKKSFSNAAISTSWLVNVDQN
jgi:hypothetical protein